MTKLFILLILQLIPSCFFLQKFPVFFPLAPRLNNGGYFSLSDAGVPPEVNLSALGKNKEGKNRKVWTPCGKSPALLLISTYMPRSSAHQCDFHELNGACDGVGR